MQQASEKSTGFSRARGILRALRNDVRGNAMILTAAAIIPIAGLIGGGVDVARIYAVKTRLQHACDAGALATRRSMTGASPTTSNIAEGNKYFDFNFNDGLFGVDRDTVSRDFAAGATSGSIEGAASADVDFTVMKIFDMDSLTLDVECTATVSVPNTDVMFVLDVTGSMSSTPSGDTMSKLAGLKVATKDFFTELGAGTGSGAGRIRYGFVPYSGTVNVGGILKSMGGNYMLGMTPGDVVNYPTRTPVTGLEWYVSGYGTESGHSYGAPSDSSKSFGSWTNYGTTGTTTISGTAYTNRFTPITSAACAAKPYPAPTDAASGGATGPTYLSTNTPVYPAATQTKNYRTTQNFNRTEYGYVWSSTSGGRCQFRRRTTSSVFTRTTPSTTTQPITWSSRDVLNGWNYGLADVGVYNIVQSNSAANPGYWSGTFAAGMSNATTYASPTATVNWTGCIEEPMGVNTITSARTDLSIPATAYDMQIDIKPNTAGQKWRPFVPGFQYVNYGSYTDWMEDAASGSDTAACPTAASTLQSYYGRTADFNTYVDSLAARGFTYHDIGLIWGARLLSADGIRDTDNADSSAPGGFQISRHMVFMTDGAMTAPPTNSSAWGMTVMQGRDGQTSDSQTTLNGNHDKRTQMLCEAAKSKGFTVWVIGFGISSLGSTLTNCATDAEHAALASNSTELKAKFQAIAETIGGVRLSQ